MPSGLKRIRDALIPAPEEAIVAAPIYNTQVGFVVKMSRVHGSFASALVWNNFLFITTAGTVTLIYT